MDDPIAQVVEGPDGKLVLIDPVGFAVMMAVAKHNCKLTLEANADRVSHFRQRAVDLGKTTDDVVIVVANVDTQFGCDLASMLMPGFNWQEIRDRGEVPFARGLAGREGLQEFLQIVDVSASNKLREFTSEEIAVVVVDFDTCEVF
jgi:hypothetical protein